MRMRQRWFERVLFSTLLLSGSMAIAADRVWNGPVNGDWFTADNWLPDDHYPQEGESVEIKTGSVLVTADTAELASLTVSNATLISSNWTTRLRATTVTLWTNGVITLPDAFTESQPSNRIHIVCNDLEVKPGGRIDADYKGFASANNATGHGPGKGVYRSGGAGHGGRGGSWRDEATYGGVYGETATPETPGSGGAGQPNAGWGGAGGGAIRIEAAGSVTVGGTISARGENGKAHGSSMHSGAGSGGSVYITCVAFGGSGGRIAADGGTGAGFTSRLAGAGGGGRIALDYGSLTGTPTVWISADAGLGHHELWTSREERELETYADAGTIWLPDSALLSESLARLSGWLTVDGLTTWNPPSLTVSNGMAVGFDGAVTVSVDGPMTVTGAGSVWMSRPGGRLESGGAIRLEDGGRMALQGDLASDGDLWVEHSGSWLVMKGNVTADVGGDLVLTNLAKASFFSGTTNTLWPEHGLRVGVTGDVWLASGSWIFPYSHSTNGGSCRFVMQGLDIAADSGFNADGRGFGSQHGVGGYGPGRGLYSGGGAGYGGRGGETGWGAGRAGSVYGNTNAPTEPGSGGATHPNARAIPYGGGLVWIEAGGAVQLDGLITACGLQGGVFHSEVRGGCGSGGGIMIAGATFGGSGELRADGGNGVESDRGGGGGGGRIAVWYAVPAARVPGILDGSDMSNVEITETYGGFMGSVSADRGIGWDNDPPNNAEDGTIVFLTIPPPRGTVLYFR